jgi:hypothetical protein
VRLKIIYKICCRVPCPARTNFVSRYYNITALLAVHSRHAPLPCRVCPPLYCTILYCTVPVLQLELSHRFEDLFSFEDLFFPFPSLYSLGWVIFVLLVLRWVYFITISFSITWKLTLLLLCLLLTTTINTTTKKHYTIMVETPCNQVMQHGSDLIGIRFFLMLHHDPDFIMFTKILKDKYDHSIDDQTEIDSLLFFDDVRDKLVSTTLKDLKLAFAKSAVEQSIHLSTTTVANNGLSLFKALPFKWMKKSGTMHLIQSSNDLAKAVDFSIDTPSPTHSMYSKELIIYVVTSGLYCERDDVPDCSMKTYLRSFLRFLRGLRQLNYSPCHQPIQISILAGSLPN